MQRLRHLPGLQIPSILILSGIRLMSQNKSDTRRVHLPTHMNQRNCSSCLGARNQRTPPEVLCPSLDGSEPMSDTPFGLCGSNLFQNILLSKVIFIIDQIEIWEFLRPGQCLEIFEKFLGPSLNSLCGHQECCCHSELVLGLWKCLGNLVGVKLYPHDCLDPSIPIRTLH